MAYKMYSKDGGIVHETTVEIMNDGNIILSAELVRIVDESGTSWSSRVKSSFMQFLVDDGERKLAVSFKAGMESMSTEDRGDGTRSIKLSELLHDCPWIKPGIYKAKRNRKLEWELTFSKEIIEAIAVSF